MGLLCHIGVRAYLEYCSVPYLSKGQTQARRQTVRMSKELGVFVLEKRRHWG